MHLFQQGRSGARQVFEQRKTSFRQLFEAKYCFSLFCFILDLNSILALFLNQRISLVHFSAFITINEKKINICFEAFLTKEYKYICMFIIQGFITPGKIQSCI